MKRLNLLLAFLLLGLITFSQSVEMKNDITHFLNIPVDGSEKEMFKAIKNKGFKQTKYGNSKALSGRFNDNDVIIMLHTNNGKVYRVAVLDDKPRNKYAIKTRYNELCHQFENNQNYCHLGDQSIPEEENIAIEMSNGKQYQAIFYQEPEEELLHQLATEKVNSTYTMEELNAMSDEERKVNLTACYALAKVEVMDKKPVWFTILEDSVEGYRIVIFYQNEYNQSNGTDL